MQSRSRHRRQCNRDGSSLDDVSKGLIPIGGYVRDTWWLIRYPWRPARTWIGSTQTLTATRRFRRLECLGELTGVKLTH